MHVIEWNRCSDFAQGQYARQTVGIISWCRYTKNFSDSWDDSVWTVWFETPDAILIAIRRFEELNLYLLGYDFENYQVSFHQEINRCTKIVTPTSDMKIHMECMREELSVIKPVILLKLFYLIWLHGERNVLLASCKVFITGHMYERRGWCALCQRSILMLNTYLKGKSIR